jgi:heptaprenyl diphosphate synthase
MTRVRKEKKRELYLVVFVLLALYFSLFETIIPKPFPWMKIGLSNLATIIVLVKFGPKMAYEVLFLRIFIQGMMIGTLFTPGFFISLISGIISTSTMCFLYRFKNHLSLVSISILSAFTHNLTQLVVVYFLLFRSAEIMSKSVLIFVMIFLGIGVISGGIIGIIASKLRLRESE